MSPGMVLDVIFVGFGEPLGPSWGFMEEPFWNLKHSLLIETRKVGCEALSSLRALRILER